MGDHGGQGGDRDQHRRGVSASLGGGQDGPMHHQHQGKEGVNYLHILLEDWGEGGGGGEGERSISCWMVGVMKVEGSSVSFFMMVRGGGVGRYISRWRMRGGVKVEGRSMYSWMMKRGVKVEDPYLVGV